MVLRTALPVLAGLLSCSYDSTEPPAPPPTALTVPVSHRASAIGASGGAMVDVSNPFDASNSDASIPDYAEETMVRITIDGTTK